MRRKSSNRILPAIVVRNTMDYVMVSLVLGIARLQLARASSRDVAVGSCCYILPTS